jgi:hypothetical protein
MMKKIMTVLFFMFTTAAFSENVAVVWEFNTAGDTEGWETSFGIADMTAADSMLVIKTANSFPTIVSSQQFTIAAEDYGYIYIRMQAYEAAELRIYWQKSDSSVVFIPFSQTLTGDSLFHDYRIPIYKADEWTGDIISLAKIQISGPLSFAGNTVKIDYIRIVGVGVKPEIVEFKPLRTVLKTEQIIPFIAVVRNAGDKAGQISSQIDLNGNIEVVSGSLQNDHGLLQPEESDTVYLELRNSFAEKDTAAIDLHSETDTVSYETVLNFRDQYWRQKEFFLSAWSPPSLNTEAYDYYTNANFDLVLTVYPDEGCTSVPESYGIDYQVRAGYLVGEETYLRASDNTAPPDLMDEDLAKLDNMIETYKDRELVQGYYLTDEPNAHAFKNLGRMVEYLSEKDPTRLSFINLFPTYASKYQLGTETYDEHIEQFLDISKPELLSYDHYHFFNGYDGTGYFYNLGIIRKWAVKYDIPFCNIIQAIGTDSTGGPDLNWRVPNANEHRWLVYSSIAYGAKAIVWFHWDSSWGVTGSPKRDEVYASIKQMNKEIKNIGPYVIALHSTEVYHTGTLPSGAVSLPDGAIVKTVSGNPDMVLGFYKDDAGEDYMMLMNRNYSDTLTADISLNFLLSGLQAFDADSGYWYEVNYIVNEGIGSEFSATLLPGGGILYQLSGERVTGIGAENNILPEKFELKQNYPNPFNPATTIEYAISSKEAVKLIVYDMLGREAAVLVDKEQNAGRYTVKWNASKFASGVYICSLRTPSKMINRKMLLLK